MNKYGVKLSGPGGVSSRPKLSAPELLCQLKNKVEVTTLTSDLQPFSAQPWASQLPPDQLTSDLGPYKTCAVVSSAGSLRNSGLGKEIGERLISWILNKIVNKQVKCEKMMRCLCFILSEEVCSQKNHRIRFYSQDWV